MVILTLVVGVWKFFHAHEHRDVIFSAISWDVLNLIILNACIGVLYERRQRRATPRVPTNMAATLSSQVQACEAGEHSAGFPCRVLDISSSGAQLSFDAALAPQIHQGLDRLHVFNRAFNHDSTVPIIVRNSFLSTDHKTLQVGVQFTDHSVAGLSETVSLSSGDSQRWAEYREHRNRPRGIVKGVLLLIRLGTVHAGGQYLLFFRELGAYMKRLLLDPVLSLHFFASFPYKIRKFYAYLIS